MIAYLDQTGIFQMDWPRTNSTAIVLEEYNFDVKRVQVQSKSKLLFPGVRDFV